MGRASGPEPGPLLMVVAGLHGNEPAGVEAVDRVLGRLQAVGMARGDLVALIGNRAALAQGSRFMDRDLNRGWIEHSLPAHPSAEDREQQELLAAVDEALGRSRGDGYLLDLHTTSGRGRPFSVFADTLRNRAFAQRFPSPLILGLEEHLEGTLIDFLSARGIVAVAFEGGEHTDPAAARNLEAAIWLALDALRLLPTALWSEVRHARARLRLAGRGLPAALEIRARHHFEPEDQFRMHPGFRSFDRVRKDQLLACDRNGEIRAPRSGLLLMPLYQQQGEDGFFIVVPVRRLWLSLSRLLRTMRLDRVVHRLPGIHQSPTHPDILLVNRRVARWYALEILHLLGFRRLTDDPRWLRVRRRRHDLP